MLRSRRSFAACVIACAALAPAAHQASAQSIRDSAGIVIVENRAPDRTLVAFRLSDAPLARIAADTTAGEGPLLLGNLAPLPDGRIVGTDPNNRQLRFYDATGKQVDVVGGPGAAGLMASPTIRTVSRARGDSIIAVPAPHLPPMLLDGRGQAVRELLPIAPSMAMQLSGGTRVLPVPVGMFSDGTIAISVPPPPTIRSPTWRPMGDRLDLRNWRIYLRVSADGATLLDTIGIVPGSDMTPTYSYTGQGTSGSPVRMNVGFTLPSLRRTSVAVDTDRFVVAEGTTYEVRAYSPSGQLQRIIRAAAPPRPLTREEIERLTADAVRNLTGEARETALRSIASLNFPTTRAAFGTMRVDDAHRIWVEATLDEGEAPYWTVFDREGRLLGSVAVPAERRIAWISADQIALTSVINARAGMEIVVYRLVPVGR